MADANAVISGRNFKVYSAAYNVANELPHYSLGYGLAWGAPNSMPTAWEDRGYTIGGLEFNAALERGEIRVDQEFDPVVRPVTARNITLGTSFAEITPENIQLASGMGTESSQAAGSATNEVQEVAISGTPTGGTFTLTFHGQTTAAIAYDAAASAVQSALEALSNVSSGDVSCSGGALPGSAVTVTFQGNYAATDVEQMTADGSGLTGGTSPDAAVTTTTPGVSAKSAQILTIGSDISDQEYSWGFDIKQPNSQPFRIIVYRGIASGSPNLAFSADDAAVIELEVTALPDTNTSPTRIAKVMDVAAS